MPENNGNNSASNQTENNSNKNAVNNSADTSTPIDIEINPNQGDSTSAATVDPTAAITGHQPTIHSVDQDPTATITGHHNYVGHLSNSHDGGVDFHALPVPQNPYHDFHFYTDLQSNISTISQPAITSKPQQQVPPNHSENELPVQQHHLPLTTKEK